MVTARYFPCWRSDRVWHLELYRKQNKYISSLCQTHINCDQMHEIRNKWLGPIFCSPGDIHTEGLLALIHLHLEGGIEVDTDPKMKVFVL